MTQLLVILLSLAANAETAPKNALKESLEKRCESITKEHVFNELIDEKDSTLAYVCYLNGKKDGPTATVYSGGKEKTLGEYRNGVVTGKWTRWYSNGNKKDEGQWVNGKPNGEWKFWNEDGTLKTKGQMVQGEKVCEWTDANYPPAPGEVCSKTFYTETWWNYFQASVLYAAQSTSAYAITGKAQWLPTFSITTWLALRPNFGVSFLKGSDGSTFPSIEGALRLAFKFPFDLPLLFEVGGGIQRWTSAAESSQLITTSQLDYVFEKSLFNVIKTKYIFLCQSKYLFPNSNFNNGTSEISLGLGLSL